MMQQILITYKNGTSINIDVPHNYYKDKYPKKSEAKINKIFTKEYQKFVAAINSTENSMLYVNKYLAFSNANISCKDVLSIDLKIIDDGDIVEPSSIQISGTPNQVCLNLNGTSIEELVTKINNLSLIENVDKLIQKFLAYFNKSNVEFIIKTAAKKKAMTNTIVASKKKIESATSSSVNLEEPTAVDNK